MRPRLPGGARFIVSTGLTFLLTLEFLRAWAVSMPLLYQGFTTLSPVLLGFAVFSPFLVGFGAAFALGHLPARRLRLPCRRTIVRWAPEVAPVAIAAGSRLALQFVGGGFRGFAIALVGLAACIWLLIAVAPRRFAVLGLVAALAADAILLMALKTESLVFRNSWGAVAGTVLLVAAFLVARWRSAVHAERSPGSRLCGSRPLSWSHSSVMAWLAFGVVLVLHLTVATLPAPLEAATGWSAGAARAAVAGSYAAGAVLALWAAESPSSRLLRAAPRLFALAMLAVSLPGLIEGSPTWSIVTSFALPLGLLTGMATLSQPGRAVRSLWVRLAAATALAVGVGIPFVYYLGFVYRYAFEPKWLLVGTATACLAFIGAGAVAELSLTRRRLPVRPAAPVGAGEGRLRLVKTTAMILVTTALLLVLPGLSPNALGRPAAEGFPVRIISYNIFMGLGADVNLDLDRLADQIARQKPDVIALQEVSRGWFTSGSIDLLPRLAERLGYSYHFFPAADNTWGNALLTNLPSEEYTDSILPRGTAAMRRGWGSALLELGDGRRMLVVVSHLHHPHDGQTLRGEQAQALVDGTVSLAGKYDPLPLTVLVGDMNAEADSAELTPVRSFFWDAFTDDPLPTYPSWAPKQRIDHIFISDGLRASDPAVFGGPASDHLGIAVNVSPAED